MHYYIISYDIIYISDQNDGNHQQYLKIVESIDSMDVERIATTIILFYVQSVPQTLV